MMKTADEWFDKLPEPYRSEALDAVSMTGKGASMYIKLSDAIVNSFSWENTRSKDEWSNLFDEAKHDERSTLRGMYLGIKIGI